MAALPYMQFYVADYLADTMHLSTEEHGAYLLLIFNYWQTGKPLPKNRLAGIARLSNDRWTDVERSLNEFFIDDGKAWVHQRIERDLLSVKGAQSQRSEAGKKSAQKRAEKKAKENQGQSNERSTGVERDGNERSTNKDPDKDKDLKDKHRLPGAEKNQLQANEESEAQVFITLPLNDGTEFPVTEPMLVEFDSLYPSVDVQQELRNQRGWLLSEPRRRKTRRGIKKFITGWLAREQDRGTKPGTGGTHAKPKPAAGNGGESRAMQKFHEAARAKFGENYMEFLEGGPELVRGPLGGEERGGTVVSLDRDDWEAV